MAFASANPIDLSIPSESPVVEAGEKLEVAISIKSPSEEAAEFSIKRFMNNVNLETESEGSLVGEVSSVTGFQSEEPASYIWEVKVGEETDRIGAIVSPEDIEPGLKRPKDFDSFWKAQKKLVKKMPLDAQSEPIDLSSDHDGYAAFEVEISSPGPEPMRAILAKPEGAAPGSLPIIIQYRAAGVKGIWCRAQTEEALGFAKRGGGALVLDTNAHGMLNLEEESYYENLENGPLQNYWDKGVQSRDTFYFRFMYLRALRAIEYMTQQPEWDGKRILVVGESQGGGQALAMAGLDPRVTDAVVTVPAMGDFGAPLVGRKAGWPQPLEIHGTDNQAAIATVPYFDTAHLLKGSKANIVAEIGLIDDTCPSTSIYAALNQSSGQKTIYAVPYRAHPWPEGADREEWDKTVLAAKNAYIDAFAQ